MANSVDPDQMLHSMEFDLGLHCLLRIACTDIWDYYGLHSCNRTSDFRLLYVFCFQMQSSRFFILLHIYICVCIYVCIYMCVCMIYVCVCI